MKEQAPDLFTGLQLAVADTNAAMQNADRQFDGWTDEAYFMLQEFLKKSKQFMCEEFREFCEKKGLPVPPSKRAFGGIIMRAKYDGLIRKIRLQNVKNPKAHMANAAVWEATGKAALA